jgi:hypothetical protein
MSRYQGEDCRFGITTMKVYTKQVDIGAIFWTTRNIDTKYVREPFRITQLLYSSKDTIDQRNSFHHRPVYEREIGEICNRFKANVMDNCYFIYYNIDFDSLEMRQKLHQLCTIDNYFRGIDFDWNIYVWDQMSCCGISARFVHEIHNIKFDQETIKRLIQGEICLQDLRETRFKHKLFLIQEEHV